MVYSKLAVYGYVPTLSDPSPLLESCIHGSSPDHSIFVLVCTRTILGYSSSLFSSLAQGSLGR